VKDFYEGVGEAKNKTKELKITLKKILLPLFILLTT